ncbi:juvenile hormone epoxide hydrolase 1 isoform X2 [Bactrocera tryoni]|uniref:juvenile hormone epoxide hydrolase 1 isoform X2 n=1 Tax=Bactrocera tryoni TaxID=59916 RepID=UPI001A9794D6|nr:juvenile hormone epoxide hydrolase 1 isoform X2 [Bactrocera tryoni]
MGTLLRITFVVLAIVVGLCVYKYQELTSSAPIPQLNDAEYWGPGSAAKYKENTAIKAFDISAKKELIEDLKAQLSRPLVLTEPLEGVGFQYGFNTNYLKEVVAYWRDTYLPKWGEREAFLKQFPHFETQIQGLRVHFIHVKPKSIEGKKVVPLLLIHGWPGSVREFYRLIPLLTKPNPKSEYVFEVIAPSLPGYGWSQGASKVNFGPAQMSLVLRNLMLRLGQEKFLIQGGDWGAILGANIVTLSPQNVLGYHSNFCFIIDHPMIPLHKLLRNWFPSFFIKEENRIFLKPLYKEFILNLEESGYMHIQASKPDTIGTTLSQNPVGLAAYILEKFSTWTNPAYKQLENGGLTKRFTLDELLDIVMIYYTTNSITTSQRLYSEGFTIAHFALNLDATHINVPTGCARFIHDFLPLTDFELGLRFKNIVHSTYHKEGGHFAAMEVPETLYSDFVEFVAKVFTKPQSKQ